MGQSLSSQVSTVEIEGHQYFVPKSITADHFKEQAMLGFRGEEAPFLAYETFLWEVEADASRIRQLSEQHGFSFGL